MVVIGDYCIEQYPKQNKIVIYLPQTCGTLTNTQLSVSDRKEELTNTELYSMLMVAKTLLESKEEEIMAKKTKVDLKKIGYIEEVGFFGGVKMTYEEALIKCEPLLNGEWKEKEVQKLVCDALEKQIPKSPNYIGDGYADGAMVYDEWECPKCGEVYEIDDQYSYCPNCGQAIDWSEE